MKDEDIDGKLKTQRVESCLNCGLFIDCENIGMIDECEDSFEVESEKVVVIVNLDEYLRLKSNR